ncbi:MAG: hypothetical protein HKN68_22810 [Saprospiraceae bacterium]|nr:hypothetical protein [Saprospiraceae bacterium]
MKKKFKTLLYAEVFIKRLTNRKEIFRATIKLGVPGRDIIISHKEHSLSKLWKESVQDIHRYLSKHKKRSLNIGN